MHKGLWWQIPNGGGRLEELEEYGRITLIYLKQDDKVWTGLTWLKRGPAIDCVNTVMNVQVP
jgi:hypothetical protein